MKIDLYKIIRLSFDIGEKALEEELAKVIKQERRISDKDAKDTAEVHAEALSEALRGSGDHPTVPEVERRYEEKLKRENPPNRDLNNEEIKGVLDDVKKNTGREIGEMDLSIGK